MSMNPTRIPNIGSEGSNERAVSQITGAAEGESSPGHVTETPAQSPSTMYTSDGSTLVFSAFAWD